DLIDANNAIKDDPAKLNEVEEKMTELQCQVDQADANQVYKITFVTEGSAVEAISAKVNTAVALPASALAGSTFNGWFTDEARATAVTLNAEGKYVVTGNVTLYAKFTTTVSGPADYTEYDALYAILGTLKDNDKILPELLEQINEKYNNPLSRELTADQQGVVDNEVAAIRAILDQILYSDGHGGYTNAIQDSALIHFNVTFNWLSTTLTKTVVKGEGVIAPNVTQMYGVNGHEKHYVFDKWISNTVPANEEAELAAPAVNLNAITEDTVVRGYYRAEDHTGTWTLHPATCEQASQLEITCTTCGVHFTKNGEQGALGHDWDDGRVITEGNCAHPGVMLYTCKRDASHTKNEVIPQTAHVDANRDEICDVCHNPMPGHQHTDWNGDEKCDVCGGKTGVHQHVDDNRDGVCDGCGRNMDGSFRCNLCPFWEQYRGIPVAGWFLTAFHFFYHLICQIVSWR
ncbi:MAG: InlB B-repeat-containing protein, partial [Clostridia bacterium]|nr:InlB B-repeat-containing protein [Clostridia bacterium]